MFAAVEYLGALSELRPYPVIAELGQIPLQYHAEATPSTMAAASLNEQETITRGVLESDLECVCLYAFEICICGRGCDEVGDKFGRGTCKFGAGTVRFVGLALLLYMLIFP